MRRIHEPTLCALVEGRIIVGAAAAAIGAMTSTILGLPLSPALGALLLAATVLIYDLDEILDRRGGPARVPRIVLTTALAAALVLVVALAHLHAATNLVVVLGLPACAFYAVPLGCLDGGRLKDHAIGKAAYVALAVTTATVLLPCVEAGVRPASSRLVVSAAWVFAAVLGNAVACDLRDVKRDVGSGRRSLAVLLGPRRTVRVLDALYLTAFAGTLAASLLGLVPIVALIPLAATPLALVALRRGALRHDALRRRAPTWAWSLLLDGAFLPLLLFV